MRHHVRCGVARSIGVTEESLCPSIVSEAETAIPGCIAAHLPPTSATPPAASLGLRDGFQLPEMRASFDLWGFNLEGLGLGFRQKNVPRIIEPISDQPWVRNVFISNFCPAASVAETFHVPSKPIQ